MIHPALLAVSPSQHNGGKMVSAKIQYKVQKFELNVYTSTPHTSKTWAGWCKKTNHMKQQNEDMTGFFRGFCFFL